MNKAKTPSSLCPQLGRAEALRDTGRLPRLPWPPSPDCVLRTQERVGRRAAGAGGRGQRRPSVWSSEQQSCKCRTSGLRSCLGIRACRSWGNLCSRARGGRVPWLRRRRSITACKLGCCIVTPLPYSTTHLSWSSALNLVNSGQGGYSIRRPGNLRSASINCHSEFRELFRRPQASPPLGPASPARARLALVARSRALVASPGSP